MPHQGIKLWTHMSLTQVGSGMPPLPSTLGATRPSKPEATRVLSDGMKLIFKLLINQILTFISNSTKESCPKEGRTKESCSKEGRQEGSSQEGRQEELCQEVRQEVCLEEVSCLMMYE